MPTGSAQRHDTADKVVIRETRRSSSVGKVVVGLMGLGLIALWVSYQPTLDLGPAAAPWVALLTMFAVLALGVGTLLAWRKSGDYEAVEIQGQRIRWVVAPFKKPFFDALLEETRVQRFVLPKGSWKLFLRDGQHAVELGGDLEPQEREALAERLERLVRAHGPTSTP